MTPDSWTVVDDGRHNAFTDLVHWREAFWLAFVSSPTHFASRASQIVLLRSADGRDWLPAARFGGRGQDIRDPKLAVLGDRLLLTALLNRSLDPRPYRTQAALSPDGIHWPGLAPAAPDGWLLGRPRPAPGGGWLAAAHHLGLACVRLFRSADGHSWQPGTEIARGGGVDETALEFLPDGRLLAVSRLEAGGGLFGSPRAGTLLSAAEPPFERWAALGVVRTTRLDGPVLLRHGERVYAAGRSQPHVAGPFAGQGSVLARKRTSLFRVEPAAPALVPLLDLPSAGDTAYPGVAVQDGNVYISYYTSPPGRDPSWLAGMLGPTQIRLAAIDLDGLEGNREEPVQR